MSCARRSRLGHVWNYDPISRGLKLYKFGAGPRFVVDEFGTMTRFLGD